MKKYLILLTACALALCGCGNKVVEQDDTPVSILVSQGHGREFYEKLAADVKEKYDIDVKFIYCSSNGVTAQIMQDIANGPMPADIVFSSTRIPQEYVSRSCIDLLSKSNVTSAYTYEKIKECTSSDGGVYQLPVTSKLIGISYNATLMEELGCKPPKNFAEMVALKNRCDREGIPFANSEITLQGDGFNYLFHIMGTQWLSTIEGAEWLQKFREGEVNVEQFRKASVYFKKWVEAGLFGDLNPVSSSGVLDFVTKRFLFHFGTTNRNVRYSGEMVDIAGNPNGRILNDEYKCMPWISEDGLNNCFTSYDDLWVMVSAGLLSRGKEEKLAKALKVVGYLSDPDFATFTSGLSPDIYLSYNGYTPTEDKLYADYVDDIKAGFVQPLYYNMFDLNTIINTGSEIGSYILNKQCSAAQAARYGIYCIYHFNPLSKYDTIFDTLQASLTERLSDLVGIVDQYMDYQQAARLVAVGGALALQSQLNMNGDSRNIQVAIQPYCNSREDMEPWRDLPVENSPLYPGDFTKAYLYAIVPIHSQAFVIINMTGAELKDILEAGFTHTYSPGYGPFPYACVVRHGVELKDDEEYLVAVSPSALPFQSYKDFIINKRIQVHPEDHTKTYYGSTIYGIESFFASHPHVAPDFEW